MILAAACTALVLDGDMPEVGWEQIEDRSGTVTRAGWWIDRRSSEPCDLLELPELLDAVGDADRPSPFV
ncbi:hypothetical protein J5Y04_13350 [Kitasatospora sp. RG8]|uniref:hypothetical protein n=1 Tax=Kitasatospora sp. RG8 TaxID=2820815 RepID=UPI001AE037C8|nr:hypothetical protein [Kitasatospora sp. RG8]MBP0450528.1 hypothetical protein [Kitasatospora sp. RG8]